MDSTVEAALIGAVAALIGVGGTVVVAIAGSRSTRQTNQATIDAARETNDAAVKAARETNQVSVDAARESQFADRYSKALDQVGADNLYVRIGGIYALEAIAADSHQYQPTVLEVLTSFVREHTPDAADERRRQGKSPDVQAALTVVGRRKTEYGGPRVNLSRASLSRADLAYADLVGANLSGADLAGADLTRADLTSADLTDANLADANLLGANLLGTYLTRANLAGASLTGADLTRANLTGADPTDADLAGANLSRALWPEGAAIPSGWVGDDNPAESMDAVLLLRRDAPEVNKSA